MKGSLMFRPTPQAWLRVCGIQSLIRDAGEKGPPRCFHWRLANTRPSLGRLRALIDVPGDPGFGRGRLTV
jgi:hypothetical protein